MRLPLPVSLPVLVTFLSIYTSCHASSVFCEVHEPEEQLITDTEGKDTEASSPSQSIYHAKANISPPDKYTHQLGPLETEPSAIINGVNVISGTFSYITKDIVVKGAQPIAMQRIYVNGKKNYRFQSLKNGWNFTHEGLALKTSHNNSSYVRTEEGGAVSLWYSGSGETLALDNSCTEKGLTNCGMGGLSAQSNMKNTRVEIVDANKDTARLELYLGSGTVRSYKEVAEDTFFDDDDEDEQVEELERQEHDSGIPIFVIDEERTPHNNKYKYRYCENFDDERLNSIVAQDKNGKELSRVFLHYPKKFDHDPRIILRASDNREILYRFQKTKKGNIFLDYVERDEAPIESYEYAEQDPTYLTRITNPDCHFLEIDYYFEENSWQGMVADTSTEAFRYKRVWMLRAPVGTDSHPVITHKFNYHREKNGSGITGVHNAYDYKTDYVYDKNKRLTTVIKFDAEKKPYSYDRLNWGKNDSPDRCNLISRHFEFGDKAYFLRCFKYDRKGNVIEDKLYGSLTGKNSPPLVIGVNNLPMDNGCEAYAKTYVYDDSDYNLLLEEHDGRKTNLYDYYKDTDLLKSRFIKVDGKVVQRHFYKYDEANAVLIEEVVDDGSSFLKKDLTGVTERHITKITPRSAYPIGLPEIIEEKYLDLKSKAEVLLKRTENEHSKSGRLISQKIYDANNELAYTLSWGYNDMGCVIEETNALGQKTFKKYDQNGNLTDEQGPNPEYHKEYMYDYANRLIREETVHKNMHLGVTYLYDKLSHKIGSIDMYGNETRYEYDFCGRLIKTTLPDTYDEGGNKIERVLQTQYDRMNNPVVLVDAHHKKTRSAFTIRGEPYCIEYADGGKETREYTLDGLLERSVARNGTVTVYHYDALGRNVHTEVFSKEGELLATSSKRYNAFHLLSETDPAGHVTQYEYDGAGRLVATRKGNSLTTQTYDAHGRVASRAQYATDTSWSTTQFQYDLLNRIIEESVEDESGKILKKVAYRYDVDGNRNETTSWIDNKRCTTKVKYNPFHEPIQSIDEDGNVTNTSFHYQHVNENGQHVAKKEITDSLGNITVIICNTMGKEEEIYRKNSLGQIVQKEKRYYDAVGNLVSSVATVYGSETPDREIKTLWKYDVMNRLTDIWEGVGTEEQKHTEIRYNAFGQKEFLIKPNGITLEYEYDALDRISHFESSDHSLSYSYTYDPNNHPVKIEGLDGTTQRIYDNNDRVISETLANGLEITYGYDLSDRPVEVILPDQSKIQYTYNGCYLQEITRVQQGVAIYKHQYSEHDLCGHITTEKMIGTLGEAKRTYDQLGRIKKLDSPYFHDTLEYDSVGNMKQRTFTDSLGTIVNKYSYDCLHQLQNEEGAFNHSYKHDSLNNRTEKDGLKYSLNAINQLQSDGQSHYKYDASGNLYEKETNGAIVTYTYDALDRLKSVATASQQTCYTYDSEGRRLSKSTRYLESDRCEEAGLRFLYQGQNEIGAYKGNELVQLRILGQGLGAEIGSAVAMELEGKTYGVQHDHQGNVVSLIGYDDSQVVGSYRYTAFGEEQVEGMRSPWRFSSKRVDEESGLVYFGCRYYDPTTGRWLTTDPIGHLAGPNLYAYVGNNPLTHIDNYGLFGESIGAAFQAFGNFIGSAINTASHALSNSNFGKSVRDGVCWLATLPGKVIEFVGFNFIPIPYVRDLVELPGHLLQGKSLSSYEPSYKRYSSYRYFVGDYVADFIPIQTNGILTGFKTAWNRGLDLCREYKGAMTCLLIRPSQGLLSDFTEWAYLRLGLSTPTSRATQACLNCCAEAVGSEGDLLVYAHSLGGEVLNSIRSSIAPAIKQMMSIRTFGSPSIINPEGFKEVISYISIHDAVPMFLDPVNYFGAMLGYCDHVVFLNSSSWPLIDHNYDGRTYSDARRQDVEKNSGRLRI